MACRALWNAVSDESFHSDLLSETDFMHSIKESENKDVKCIFCDEKFFEDERREIWIKCFSCSLWGYLDFTEAENAEYILTFINRLETEIVYA